MRKLSYRSLLGLFLSVMIKQALVFAGPIEELRPGEWYEVPNSKIRSVLPNPIPPGGTGPESIIIAWSGGAFDTARNQYLVTGGGHNDYGGNEIYAFSMNTLQWSRIWGPSPNIPPTQGSCNETYSDGNAASRHTYDGLEYLPKVDRFWVFGGSLYCGTGGSSQATWHFNLGSLQWERKANFPTGNARLEMVSGYDSLTGRVYFAGGETWLRLGHFDPVANTWTTGVSSDTAGFGQNAAIDPKRRKMVVIGDGVGYVFDLTTGVRSTLTATGGTAIVAARYPGIEYDPTSDLLVAWHGGSTVYTLDLDANVWRAMPVAPTNTVTPTAAPSQGTHGRWRYVPSKNVFIVVNSIDENVFVYKLSTDSPTVSIPPSPPMGLIVR